MPSKLAAKRRAFPANGVKGGLRLGCRARIVGGMNFNYAEFFERRQDVCGGETVVKGTRVTVRTLLASLAEGASVEEILADFPTVSREAMRAVIAFAAASAEEDMPMPPAPAVA